jgi:hypothetical protein
MLELLRQYVKRGKVVVLTVMSIVTGAAAFLKKVAEARLLAHTSFDAAADAALIAAALLLAFAAVEFFVVDLHGRVLDRLRFSIARRIAFAKGRMYVTELHEWPGRLSNRDEAKAYENWLLEKIKDSDLVIDIVVDDEIAADHRDDLVKFAKDAGGNCHVWQVPGGTARNEAEASLHLLRKALHFDVVVICRNDTPREAFLVLPRMGRPSSPGQPAGVVNVMVFRTTDKLFLERWHEVLKNAITSCEPLKPATA